MTGSKGSSPSKAAALRRLEDLLRLAEKGRLKNGWRDEREAEEKWQEPERDFIRRVLRNAEPGSSAHQAAARRWAELDPCGIEDWGWLDGL